MHQATMLFPLLSKKMAIIRVYQVHGQKY